MRGTQGNSIGRNTTGGALNILTNDPVDNFEANVRGEVGTHGYTRFNGTVTVPLEPRLSARATYSFNNREGFSRNETIGRKAADQERHFVRGSIKYEGEACNIIVRGATTKIAGNLRLHKLHDN